MKTCVLSSWDRARPLKISHVHRKKNGAWIKLVTLQCQHMAQSMPDHNYLTHMAAELTNFYLFGMASLTLIIFMTQLLLGFKLTSLLQDPKLGILYWILTLEARGFASRKMKNNM